MTTTINVTDEGNIFVQTAGATAGSIAIDGSFPVAALYHFSLSPNIAFISTLTLDTVLTGSGTYFVLVLDAPDLFSALPNGALLPSQIPAAYSVVQGTAASIELARSTLTSGAVRFNLDLALLTRFMSTSLNYSGGWNGHLVLWLCAAPGDSGSFTQPVLTAFDTLDRPNRDTGRSGEPPGSRVSRCPVTGLMVSRQRMVTDGWREVKVHPLAYDPPEPEPLNFEDFPEED